MRPRRASALRLAPCAGGVCGETACVGATARSRRCCFCTSLAGARVAAEACGGFRPIRASIPTWPPEVRALVGDGFATSRNSALRRNSATLTGGRVDDVRVSGTAPDPAAGERTERLILEALKDWRVSPR